MAVKAMTGHASVIDKAINTSCDMIYDIEDLLNRAPQQLESYTALVKILKDMKRGIPSRKSINIHGVSLCPPGMAPTEICEGCTCQACWDAFITEYLSKIKTKGKEKENK